MNMVTDCDYLNKGLPMPFCKGCGHTNILKRIDEALSILNLEPKDVCLVTDIGCIGLSDALFDKIHTVHTTHGRSTAFATGIALADKVLAEKKLKTIVLIGDGGSMIGLLHIVNAALINVDVTVIVANNFLFGMTGGQQSSLTPEHFVTQTSPFGTLVPALDICAVADASKAGYIARKTSTDKDLTDTIAWAIAHNGFSIIEVLELCTEHATKRNELKGNMLTRLAEAEGHKMGIIKESVERKEFSRKYADEMKKHKSKIKHPLLIEPVPEHNLSKPAGIIVAGSAGERVQSSAGMLCVAAVNCGLYTTQKNDNPVTQGSGFSLSEVIISPDEIYYTGVDKASYVIVVSEEGYRELLEQKIFDRVNNETTFIVDESISFSNNGFNIVTLPLRKTCSGEKAALGAIDYLVKKYNPFPHERFKVTVEKKYEKYEDVFKKEYYELSNSRI